MKLYFMAVFYTMTSIFKNVIPTVYHKYKTVCTNDEKAELLNDYFCTQSSVDDLATPLPDLHQSRYSLGDVVITQEDVKDAITTMDPFKASYN